MNAFKLYAYENMYTSSLQMSNISPSKLILSQTFLTLTSNIIKLIDDEGSTIHSEQCWIHKKLMLKDKCEFIDTIFTH